MSNVIPIGGYTRLDIDPDKVLDGAKENLETVLVLGDCEDGEFYCAASTSDKNKLLFMIELFKFKLMRGDFN